MLPIYKRLTTRLFPLLLFIFIGAIFYHNGLNSNCLYCALGSYFLDFIIRNNFEISAYSYNGLLDFIEKPAIIPFIFPRGFSSRAPPA